MIPSFARTGLDLGQSLQRGNRLPFVSGGYEFLAPLDCGLESTLPLLGTTSSQIRCVQYGESWKGENGLLHSLYSCSRHAGVAQRQRTPAAGGGSVFSSLIPRPRSRCFWHQSG